MTAPPNETRRAQWLVLAAAFLGWMFDGLEMGMFPVVARPALQSLLSTTGDQDVGRWMSYITAAFLLGAASGGLVFGWLGDRIGRVRAMAASILVYSLLTGVCALVTHPWQLALFRFLAALGMGGEWSLGVALVMEYWPERRRPLLAGVIGAAANVGYASIGGLAWIVPVRVDSWRWVMLAGAAPAVLALMISLVVPESKRWRQAVQRSTAQPLRVVFGRELWADQRAEHLQQRPRRSGVLVDRHLRGGGREAVRATHRPRRDRRAGDGRQGPVGLPMNRRPSADRGLRNAWPRF